ncbi:NUDIX hydrolase [Vineibacter terrae]|uniref:NUDIX hydrolase n=1 Tax=Vineibacter terrae TaxID=2586908 RepID=UPI002E32084F|nr:hypothetical protein [Vineibacter terrae]HEX2885370.1 hypothetical protein [Vineibacter terrae]
MEQAAVVDLTAVVVAVTRDQPRVLVTPGQGRASAADRRMARAELGSAALDALPSGPLEHRHRTLEAGLRAWVEAQTGTRLDYVEQLYTFGDRDRMSSGSASRRVLSIGYLALAQEAGAALAADATWHDWYRYFPWEDWRRGRPAVLDRVEKPLRRWAGAGDTRAERTARKERAIVAFGLDGTAWSDERVLERYELLYEIGLVAEARRDGLAGEGHAVDALQEGQPMAADHRRILATAIARLRGKIKYRPVVFELMPAGFTLLQLQRAVEALAGVRLHKQNFRRLVEQQGLVEETGHIITATGGRPAREVRFREEVVLERLAPGLRLPIARASE